MERGDGGVEREARNISQKSDLMIRVNFHRTSTIWNPTLLKPDYTYPISDPPGQSEKGLSLPS